MSKCIELRQYLWDGPYAQWRKGAAHDPGLCAELKNLRSLPLQSGPPPSNPSGAGKGNAR